MSLRNIRSRPDFLFVATNTVGAGRWSANLAYVATESIDSYVAVAIISDLGCILANISHRTTSGRSTSTREETLTHVRRAVSFYREMREDGRFPSASTKIFIGLVMGRDQWAVSTMPPFDQVVLIENELASLNRPIHSRAFNFDSTRQRTAERTQPTPVLIHGIRHGGAHVYVDGAPINYDEPRRVHGDDAAPHEDREGLVRVPAPAITAGEQDRDRVSSNAHADYLQKAGAGSSEAPTLDLRVIRTMARELVAWANATPSQASSPVRNLEVAEASVLALVSYSVRRERYDMDERDIIPQITASVSANFGWSRNDAARVVNDAFLLAPYRTWPPFGQREPTPSNEQIALELLRDLHNGALSRR